MSAVILTKTYSEPSFCEKEILRYAACVDADENIKAVLSGCMEEIRGKLSYKACYCELPIDINGEVCDFDLFKIKSKDLSLNLKNCKRVILFAATIGIEIDRLISRYSSVSPIKALIFQAIGTERVEALCDAFCIDISEELKIGLRPRFSPGYGDVPLSAQEIIFNILNCSKNIGLTLTDSLLMSPSKSVTAFAGIIDE